MFETKSKRIAETFRAMQDVGMLLLLHGEIAGNRVLVTYRESGFMRIFIRLAQKFPDLKIVLEHISTEVAVDVVNALGKNVAATGENPKFFLGSDTAPHAREREECAHDACGVYSAPILPQLLAEIFDGVGRLDRLEDFATRFGAEFYGMGRNTETITLTRHEEPWEVPFQLGTVVPFRAGTKLHWQLA